MHAIEIHNLVKRYKEKEAVSGLSLTVEPGEFFGFLGANGAGKTSTIHCMSGIAKITSGTIKLFGHDVEKDYRAARAQVGLSPQEFNADFFAKVWKILDYVGGYYGMPKAKRITRIEELLKQFNLEEHKDKSFQELSGGLKRRVMLARAMIHDPEILILDEPTAGVDVELRHELWKHLQDLNKAGKTIFLTSHYLEEVELLCQRIAIINKGKVAAIGSKEDFTKDGNKLEKAYLAITKGEAW
jgi:ABC-2 type transport system ATP-binding protein